MQGKHTKKFKETKLSSDIKLVIDALVVMKDHRQIKYSKEHITAGPVPGIDIHYLENTGTVVCREGLSFVMKDHFQF